MKPIPAGGEEFGPGKAEVAHERRELGHPLGGEEIVVALVNEEGAGREAQQEQAEIGEAL